MQVIKGCDKALKYSNKEWWGFLSTFEIDFTTQQDMSRKSTKVADEVILKTLNVSNTSDILNSRCP